MGKTTEDIWTCDRCQTEARMDVSRGRSQPSGWGGVEYAHPPLRSLEDAKRWHLCPGCYKGLKIFLAGPCNCGATSDAGCACGRWTP